MRCKRCDGALLVKRTVAPHRAPDGGPRAPRRRRRRRQQRRVELGWWRRGPGERRGGREAKSRRALARRVVVDVAGVGEAGRACATRWRGRIQRRRLGRHLETARLELPNRPRDEDQLLPPARPPAAPDRPRDEDQLRPPARPPAEPTRGDQRWACRPRRPCCERGRHLVRRSAVASSARAPRGRRGQPDRSSRA